VLRLHRCAGARSNREPDSNALGARLGVIGLGRNPGPPAGYLSRQFHRLWPPAQRALARNVRGGLAPRARACGAAIWREWPGADATGRGRTD
jgi:hypothetical protein